MPEPDRPTCSYCGAPATHRLNAAWRRDRVRACVNDGYRCSKHMFPPYDRYEPIAQPMTDQPTAFEIQPDAYKAVPSDPSDVNPDVWREGDRVFLTRQGSSVADFPRAAIPAIIDALKQLQEGQG